MNKNDLSLYNLAYSIIIRMIMIMMKKILILIIAIFQ